MNSPVKYGLANSYDRLYSLSMPTETFKQYERRLLGYLGKQDPIKVQRATPGKLERLIKGVPRKKLTKRPAPGKWSVLKILAHLADVELAMGWRYRSIISRLGVKIMAYNQEDWARDFKYGRQDATKALSLFRALRENNLMLLRMVSRQKLKSGYGIHEERGKQTVMDFVELLAGHDLNHLMQIKRLLN